MRILIVEDERSLTSAIKEVLEREGYIVDICSNGLDAIDKILVQRYDVIVLDIMLPGCNGIEVLKSVRDVKIDSHVILLTAKSEVTDKIKGLNEGADDYITKPFYLEELVARIKAVSRRNDYISQNYIKCGDIVLDLSEGMLINESAGLSINLSAKEFSILELLIRNRKRLSSKDFIIERVWGYFEDAQYNNVEVYISFLRKKLKYLESKLVIKTIRGFGYKLEVLND